MGRKSSRHIVKPYFLAVIMRIDITSLCFGFKIDKENDSGTPAWATSIGQAPKDICYVDTKIEGLSEFIYGMMYKSHSDFDNLKDSDVPGLDKREEPRGDRERMMFSVFEDVYVNNHKVDGIYTLTYEREDTTSHKNRLHICYAKYLTYKGHSNKATLKEMAKILGCNDDACWFVSDINIRNQKDLHFSAIVVNPEHSMNYQNSKERKKAWEALVLEKDKTPYNNLTDEPLQQIFYGAPGTGKSHFIKENTTVKKAEEKNLVFRTTFHPDSDYSTFVGAYKPTMRSVPSQYRDALGRDEEIAYSFIPQAFLQAYAAAWNNPIENVFLIIEEINRGNCAQIFGDLFQLLDRNDNNYSEYPIIADKDIAKYLSENDENDQPVLVNEEGIKDGKLCLPPNLYIWATMNTSDQSLFPIDSAFKRRWDWKFIPISDAKKNFVLEIDNDQYDWWSFLDTINGIIESITHSEDKKLGYFFAKTKDGKINTDTFVSKVIFYLWNDVFKDNEPNHKAFKRENGELLAFQQFFHSDGSVNTNVVIKFLQDLEIDPFEIPEDEVSAPSVNTTPNTKRKRDKSRYNINGIGNLNKAQMTREAFGLYISSHSDADAQAIVQAWNGLGLKDYVQHLVETEEDFNTRTKDSNDTNKRAVEFELSNGEKIYLSTQFGIGNIGKFVDAVNNAGWNIRIEKLA